MARCAKVLGGSLLKSSGGSAAQKFKVVDGSKAHGGSSVPGLRVVVSTKIHGWLSKSTQGQGGLFSQRVQGKGCSNKFSGCRLFQSSQVQGGQLVESFRGVCCSSVEEGRFVQCFRGVGVVQKFRVVGRSKVQKCRLVGFPAVQTGLTAHQCSGRLLNSSWYSAVQSSKIQVGSLLKGSRCFREVGVVQKFRVVGRSKVQKCRLVGFPAVQTGRLLTSVVVDC